MSPILMAIILVTVVGLIGAVILVTAICKALFRVPNVRAQATAG